jgi:hypothetical protein
MRINLKHLFIAVLVFTITNTFAQVGIGTNTPVASAALEVTSDTNNKGILIPRITATQKDAISNPAEGLMIFQTSAPAGFYFYTGTAWRLMVTQTDLDLKVTKVSGKDLSSNDYSKAEKTKLDAITGTNTGDQDLSALATTIALNLKVDKISGKELSTNDFTTAEKIKLAAIMGTGVQTAITGNAGTATTLATPKNINGIAFDGSGDITVTADAGTLTGSTLNSTLTGSNLTSVGTLTSLTVIAPIVGSLNGNATTATLAETVTTNANLTGDLTSVGNATTVKQINGTALSGLATGILKNMTATGVPSIAVAADFPLLNQNTTGTAANVTGTVAVANGGTGVTSSTGTGSVVLSASPTFTGTVSGITKTMVGLDKIDNTTDLLKPISTVTQTAIDNLTSKIATLKAQLYASGALRGQLLASFTRASGVGNCSSGLFETNSLGAVLSLRGSNYFSPNLIELSASLTNGQTNSVSWTANNTPNFDTQVLYFSNLNYESVGVTIGGGGIGFGKGSTNPNWAASFGLLQGKTITEIKLVPVLVQIENSTSGPCDPYSYELKWEFYGY